MEWWFALAVILGGLIVLMITGMPTAFCFMTVTIAGAYFLWGGQVGLNQFIFNVKSALTSFAVIPLLLFVLMGGIMFETNVATLMVTTVDKLLGRLPGRLSLVTILAGTIFATLSGSSMASTAMLGTTLLPEMEKYRYKKAMSIGPILGSSGLAVMIPPSSLGVYIAVIAEESVAKILIAIIVPGLVMALLYIAYVLIRCSLQPSLAPAYSLEKIPLSEKLIDIARYIFPLAIVIFLVTGVIFLGIATPSEAAATGCLGAFVLAIAYGQFNWKSVNRAVGGSILTAVMVLVILASSTTFSQILAFSGASRGLSTYVLDLQFSPIILVIGVQILILILGCFMDVASVMMVIIPLTMPIVNAAHFDPIQFLVITLLNLEMSGITPPFGFNLFVMKNIAPVNTKFEEIAMAGLPFIVMNLVVMVLLFVFPKLSLWLPSIMGR